MDSEKAVLIGAPPPSKSAASIRALTVTQTSFAPIAAFTPSQFGSKRSGYDSLFFKKHKLSKLQRFELFIYNPYTEAVVGRNARQWAILFAFYFIFYMALFIIFVLSLFVWFIILDENYPKLKGMDSHLELNPSLGFLPQPEFEDTVIRFRHGKRATYKAYSDHLQAFLDQYENDRQTGENIIKCDNGRPNDDPTKVCRFDPNQFSETPCVKRLEYGYEDATPCILIKLNKIFGWVPVPLPKPLPGAGTSQNATDRGAEIECHGINQADIENIGPIEYYPKNYFSTYYYPYLVQDGYRQPFIMVRFARPEQQVIIMVECRVYAQNINYNGAYRLGSVRFELLID